MSSYDDLPADMKTSAAFMVVLYVYMTVCTSYATYKIVLSFLVTVNGNIWAEIGAVVGVVLAYICLKCIDTITEHYISKEKKL